jgi:proteasome assembly chaperone (PAC2) family protein
MARMIKIPGGVQHKYKDIKQKFTDVKVENEATITRAKHLEEMTQDIKKDPSEAKLQSRNKVVKLSRSDR